MLENVINFQRQNSEGKSENVKVRVVYIYHPDQSSVVQYQHGPDDSEWKEFAETDAWKLSLKDVIAENKKRDLAYATALKKTLEEGEKVSGFDLANLFKQAFEEGYIQASEVIFDKFLAQTKDKFDVAALRKFYNIINPPDNFRGHNSSGETYENTSGQPVVNLAQRQALKDLVTAHVTTRNSEHRRNIVTSSVPIDAIKTSLETSLGPRRYQAILGILKFDCGIPPEGLGGLDEYAGNADKFKKIQFDHEDSHKAVEKEEAKEFTEFNKNALALLDQEGGKLWETLDHFLRNEAYKKDLGRIVEKLKPSEDLRKEIEHHLLAIYSGGAIEEPFNQLKIILISARLKAKGLAPDKALDLATRFVVDKESLQNLKRDDSVQQMGDKKPTDKKFEAIFTKYAAFGKISDATQLRKRVVGKILSQFQKKFAEQIHHLDGIQTVEMDGSEILFRGLDQRSGLTEELITEEFEDIHVGMSTSDGVSQQLSSYRIQQERVFGPGGLANRASYAAATTFNFAVAAKYAGNAGWIYDIRPKKGKLATNMQALASNYQEIDFEAIDPEEIYAVYKVSQTSDDASNTTTRANTIEKVILNPHYKKRGDDPLGLLKEGQKIVTQEIKSNCGRGGFSVKSDDPEEPFKKFNEEQLKLHENKYSLGNHLREAASALMQNKERAIPLLASVDDGNAAVKEKNNALFDIYKKGPGGEDGDISYDQHWFWRNLGNGNQFKVFIPVEPDDLSKAAEILIKNGHFNYQQLPECSQKIPAYSKEGNTGRLAIILYAKGEKTTESDAIWAARLNAIEKDFYEAGIKPRPLVNREEAARGSLADDRKFPGSLYSYYKKDDASSHGLKWDWQNDNYFSGIEIKVAESINQKIEAITSELAAAVGDSNTSERIRLNKLLQAEQLYLQISQVTPDKTEHVQSGTNIDDDKKNAKAEVVILDNSSGSATLKKEVRKMTLERARYFWANDLRRSATVTTHNADILTAKTEAIVNAGNAVLDLGNYGISGLNKAVHDEFGYEKTTLCLGEKTGHYFKNKGSNLVKALLKGDVNTEDCTIFVGACDSAGKPILETEQAKDDEERLLFWDSKTKKLTTKSTENLHYDQAQIKVPAKKLKTGEVAIAEIDSDLDSKSKSQIGSTNGVKFIIHAVGPDCRRDEFKVLESDAKEVADGKIAARKEALKNTYKTLLEKALEKGVKKIAVPALSIGVFQYPEKEAAQVIGGVLRDFRSKFEEISIFAIDPKNKEERPTILNLIESNLFQTNLDLMQVGNDPRTFAVQEKSSESVETSLSSPDSGEGAKVVGGVLGSDSGSQLEEISIPDSDPTNEGERAVVKANDEKAWKKSPQDENSTDFAVQKPSGSVKASLFSPLMKKNKKNIWYVAEDSDGSLNPAIRANKFKVIEGIYGKEKSETSELEDAFIDILINLAAGSEVRPKRQKLEQAQVLAIITKAKERGGIKNEANKKGEYLKPASKIEDISDIPAVEAKKFSAAFQKECEACGIYSGRKGGKSVGLRLTFIPDDVVDKFTKLSAAEYAALASKSESNLSGIKALAAGVTK